MVNAPANFEISLSQTGSYGTSLNINQTPTLNATIWVRLTGATLGSFNGNVTNVAGTASVNVAVTGAVTPPNNLAVTRNGPAATTMVDNDAQGTGGNGLVILDITLATAQAAWNVTDLVFTASGTADEQAGLNFLALYEDTNTNGVFDGPGTDTLATAAAGTSFNAPNGTLHRHTGQRRLGGLHHQRFFLVCKLSVCGTAGQTVVARLTTIQRHHRRRRQCHRHAHLRRGPGPDRHQPGDAQRDPDRAVALHHGEQQHPPGPHIEHGHIVVRGDTGAWRNGSFTATVMVFTESRAGRSVLRAGRGV
ncbi:MAG: hypothetical protein HS108_02390 [Planctomycetes bacterium]|nr:hypothetical protein [Planctomycetota bacterium]